MSDAQNIIKEINEHIENRCSEKSTSKLLLDRINSLPDATIPDQTIYNLAVLHIGSRTTIQNCMYIAAALLGDNSKGENSDKQDLLAMIDEREATNLNVIDFYKTHMKDDAFIDELDDFRWLSLSNYMNKEYMEDISDSVSDALKAFSSSLYNCTQSSYVGLYTSLILNKEFETNLVEGLFNHFPQVNRFKPSGLDNIYEYTFSSIVENEIQNKLILSPNVNHIKGRALNDIAIISDSISNLIAVSMVELEGVAVISPEHLTIIEQLNNLYDK